MQSSCQGAGNNGLACYWHRLLWSHIPEQCSILNNKEGPEACSAACLESDMHTHLGSSYWYMVTSRWLLDAGARCSYSLASSCKECWRYTRLTWACVHKYRALDARVGESGQQAHQPILGRHLCNADNAARACAQGRMLSPGKAQPCNNSMIYLNKDEAANNS